MYSTMGSFCGSGYKEGSKLAIHETSVCLIYKKPLAVHILFTMTLRGVVDSKLVMTSELNPCYSRSPRSYSRILCLTSQELHCRNPLFRLFSYMITTFFLVLFSQHSIKQRNQHKYSRSVKMSNKDAGNKKENWLSRYAADYHAWRFSTSNDKKTFKRPLGLVETSFDADGTGYGGRADMNALLTLEIQKTLSKQELRVRTALAWASLRLQHVMLQSKVEQNEESGKREFTIEVQDSLEDVLQETVKSIVWIEDLYDEVDDQVLYQHCLNVARIVEPSKCLSRMHVLPLVQLPNGNFKLRFLVIMAHQTSDGLSAHNWFSHFLRILNMPEADIKRDIETFRAAESIRSRLPPAQEDLYPRISGSKARQRWFWAILRVLRHVGQHVSPTFTNPLRRETRLAEAQTFPPTFSKLFDYSKTKKPPMNSGHHHVALSKAASIHMMELCRSIKVSVGAGCFALAGIAMMEMEERRNPNVPDCERQPFTASFPLNPRAFFGFTTPADSCMLGFSDGIVMPFLPASLPIEGRFKLVAKHANRELRMYQKRLKSTDTSVTLEPHSPGRLLAHGYLRMLDIIEAKLPSGQKTGIYPQGSLPAKAFQSGATCGVSSMGSTSNVFRPGLYDLSAVGTVQGKDRSRLQRVPDWGPCKRERVSCGKFLGL